MYRDKEPNRGISAALQARLDSSARDQHLVEMMALKKDNMNKFSVIKDILSICGPFFGEETKKQWMNDLIDKGNDILGDLYDIVKTDEKEEEIEPVSTISRTSSSKQSGENLNERRTPNIKATVAKEGKATSSNKSSSSTSASSSNVVSQSQSARVENPSGPSSKSYTTTDSYNNSDSYTTTDFTSAVKKNPSTIKAPPTIKPTTIKSNANLVVPGSTTTIRISNADLEIDEKVNAMERPVKKGKL